MIKRAALLLLTLLSLAVTFPPAEVLAASASLYLSPSSGSETDGSIFSVSIHENSGSTKVNTVQANLSYPASRLSVSSVESSSAFNITAQNSWGNGSIRIARGAQPSVSGDQVVATIVFKALAASGTASVSFTSGSEVDAASNNANILSGKSGGSYTLSEASTPLSGTEPTSAKKDTTPPKISGVSVSAGATMATITWTTSEPATSEVDYGLNLGYGLTAVNQTLVTAHKLKLTSALIEPATTYHLRVKSTDEAGNSATSNDITFKTQGGILNITVVNQFKHPVSGAQISFAGMSATTDKNGQATLSNLPAGSLTGNISYKGSQTAETVLVKTADPTKPQSVKFQITTAGHNHWIYYLISGLIVLTGLGLAYWLRRRGRPRSGIDSGSPNQPTPTPILSENTASLTPTIDEQVTLPKESSSLPTPPSADGMPPSDKPTIPG